MSAAPLEVEFERGAMMARLETAERDIEFLKKTLTEVRDSQIRMENRIAGALRMATFIGGIFGALVSALVSWFRKGP